VSRELVIPEQPTQLVMNGAGTSIVGWILAYCHAEVAGAPKTTVDAKRRDFQLFLDYFAETMRSDSIDDWTRSVSLGFVRWLEGEPPEGRGYAPTSVNRTLATVRRAARWIQERRPFMAGDPFERVSDLTVTVPPAKGLSVLQRRRVLAAADKLLALQGRADQQPRRKRALLVVLLETGMRISETLRLTMDQFDGKYFRNVKRKGRRRDDVYLSPEARVALADYFDHERGRREGPVFQSRNGKPMLRRPKPNIRVTSRKVDGYAASASVGSMGKRAFMSRRKIPYGLTWL
jgi:integrase/recombinase XerD